uniref:Uncharacterized protein n=1 Tax=Tanacetum cinerariifolium TaxID=118510 RepID=A0A6L2MT17_TANCI|nr:hypothetical protein [Tanacetum cinerariifolium]
MRRKKRIEHHWKGTGVVDNEFLMVSFESPSISGSTLGELFLVTRGDKGKNRASAGEKRQRWNVYIGMGIQ